ncbi:hypothetical protein Csa_023807, partial [Cucumis sativus]
YSDFSLPSPLPPTAAVPHSYNLSTAFIFHPYPYWTAVLRCRIDHPDADVTAGSEAVTLVYILFRR